MKTLIRIQFSTVILTFSMLWCLFTITNYQAFMPGKQWGPFKSDMFAYYAYLPAIFVYNWDLDFEYVKKIPENDPVQFMPTEAPTGKFVNKVTMGMSMMMAPCFLVAHAYASTVGANTPEGPDGFSIAYRIAMYVSSVLYVLWGLILLRRVLRKHFKDWVVGLVLGGCILGTNLFFYTVHETMMSHAYSFALYCFVIYLTDRWHETHQPKHLQLLGFVMALVCLVRPTNVVIGLVFLLYNVVNIKDLYRRLLDFWQYKTPFFGALVIGLVTVYPQLWYWKKQTGQWFFYSYADWERFYWEDPAIVQGLFSYCKGWYLYTPLMLFATLGIGFVWRFARVWFWPLLTFYVVNTYIVLSWWSWWYGGGFGLRAFAEAGAVMSLGLGSLLTYLWERSILTRWASITLVVACITLNLFQTMHYKRDYIRWNGMTKERYWRVFGRTKMTKEEYDEVWEMYEEPHR